MMEGTKYIKLFDTEANYSAYINGSEVYLPNVSLITANNNVFFNPAPDSRLEQLINIDVDDVDEGVPIIAKVAFYMDTESVLCSLYVDDSTVPLQQTIRDGAATFSVNNLSAGEHTIRAYFPGDSKYRPGEGTAICEVYPLSQ